MPRKKSGRRKRYTDEQKRNILNVAAKEGLTGEQVAKRFGVATLTFYRWRGPVGRGRRPNGASSKDVVGLRAQVRSSVEQIVPRIIRQEVNAYIDRILTRRRPGRPPKFTV